MFGRLRSLLMRHPLVPLAILALVADAFYLSAVVRPRQERFFASIVPEADGEAARIRVEGEVCSVRAPVPASRGELKYRFRIRNPRFLDLDGREIETSRGTLPVVWYSPRPEKAGFAPEPGSGVVPGASPRTGGSGRTLPRSSSRDDAPSSRP